MSTCFVWNCHWYFIYYLILQIILNINAYYFQTKDLFFITWDFVCLYSLSKSSSNEQAHVSIIEVKISSSIKISTSKFLKIAVKNILVEFWTVVASLQLESMWHLMQLQQHQKLLLRHFVLASIHLCILLHRRQLQCLLWNLKNNRFF